MIMCKKIILALQVLVITSFASGSEVQLSEAYQREFIYLNNQKNNLIESKKKTLNELSKELKNLELTVDSKLNLLNQLENKTHGLQEEYKTYQDLISKNESQERKIQALALQTAETLKSFNYNINDKATPEEILKESFKKAEDLLMAVDSVKKVDKEVFDIHGKKIESEVFQFGLISAMALQKNNNKSELGLLAPAGLGQLKIVETSKSYDPFESDDKGSQKFFIYDSLNKPFESKIQKSLADVLEAGGLIGYVIIIFGLFALFVAVRRYYILNKYNFTESDKHEFIKLINQRKIQNKEEIDKANHRWMKYAALGPLYSELKYTNIKKAKNDAETLILSLDRKVSTYGPVLMGIAAVAPLLGLLGTVTGMIATFDVITEVGTGNPKMLSGGISEALVTTEFGLIVAIPCLLLGNWLNSWAKRISKDLYEIYDSTVEES